MLLLFVLLLPLFCELLVPDSEAASSPLSDAGCGGVNTSDPRSTSICRKIARVSCACSTWCWPAVEIRQYRLSEAYTEVKRIVDSDSATSTSTSVKPEDSRPACVCLRQRGR